MRAYVGEVIEKIKDEDIRNKMMNIVLDKLPKGD